MGGICGESGNVGASTRNPHAGSSSPNPAAMRALAMVAAVLLCLASALAQAQTRPRVGLVLAGGGAKGGAHVGVLKVLEELHVPVDCIAGTSMGALVGGGYAAGIPAADIEKFLLGIEWKKVVGSEGRRKLEPIEQKRAGATYSNSFELGIGDEGVTIPGGVINTGNVEDLLRTYVAGARFETDFDRLPIPYRAIATDMVAGEMVVLSEGDLATAMRASMAIPGAFEPVAKDGQILSDGGLVRNIPIDVARELCADVVIVVNLVEPGADPKKLRSALQLLGRTMDVAIIANENLQLGTLGPQDALVNVQMGTIGTADFERIPETVPLGEAAARAVAPSLMRYAVPPEQYAAWRKGVTQSQALEVQLAAVRFEGLERVNPGYLEAKAQVKAGDVVDTARISEEARRIAALQEFDTVDYRIEGDRAAPTLVWLPHEKDWGPNYLRVDLGMLASEDGDLTFAIYGRHVRTWLNDKGAEWRNEVQVGNLSMLATSLFQPLDTRHRVFVEPKLLASRSLEDVFLDQERIARYEFTDWGGSLDAGVNLGNYAQARLGYLYNRRKIGVDIGSPLIQDGRYTDAGIQFSAEFDSRDTAFNPTKGIAAAFEYYLIDDALGADRDWERVELGLGVALPLRRDVFWVTLAGGADLSDELPADRAFAVGGPGSFPGLELGEIRADRYWTASTSYLWNFKELVPLMDLAMYVGMRVNAGAVYDRIDNVDTGEFYGASIFLTGRTLVGPLTLGVGATTTDSWSLWISVGRPVGHGTILEKGIFR